MRNARGQQGKNELKNKSEQEHSNKIFGGIVAVKNNAKEIYKKVFCLQICFLAN